MLLKLLLLYECQYLIVLYILKLKSLNVLGFFSVTKTISLLYSKCKHPLYINNFTFYRSISAWILQSGSSEPISDIHIKPVSEVHGGHSPWTRFMRWSTHSSGPLMTQSHSWYWLTTLTSVRKTEVEFWGEVKIRLHKGLMKLMELNLIPYEISDASSIYLKACDSIHRLLSMLFGLHTKYTCGVFRHITGYGCFSS